MSKKLKYKIISCSSEQAQFPSSSLLFGGQNGGWQTKRFCTYPQQVTFEFYGPVRIDKIQIISDNRKISSQVDILFYMPFLANGRQSEERFQKYGYLNFNKNQNSQSRQHKSIMVDIKCLYLRFLFHKPHHSKENFFSQIGIHQISIYGTQASSSLAPIEKLPRQIGQATGNYGAAIEEDPFVAQKLAILNAQKQRAVEAEDFQTANEYKQIIDTVKKAGQQLKKLNMEKRKAIDEEDYEKANSLKKSIEKHRKQLDELITFGYDENDQVVEENQFANQNSPPALNDFQDNEFVDPEMNEMISKSRAFSAKGQNSRVVGGNSRLKINKTIIKRQNDRQKENYDQRVIPALANGNKQKTEESQLIEREEEKKELKLEQIDGKYIQYSIIMQQHFSEETVKQFFSQHWQHKVKALKTILEETKKKQNPDSLYIKCLIVVVKNSIAEVNFQVSTNCLQLLSDLLRLNSKGNLLSRNNELTNDLDAISKEVIKKMADNNNKIKVQAEKAFAQMVNSSLYGPEACAISLIKTKDKVKLSSKQSLTRLIQLSKLIQRNGGNNPQIISMATDFGIQNAKNPASQVRSEALNLLLVCREKDASKQAQKKISDKNLSQALQAFENKAGTKSPEKTSKVKKTK